MLVVAALPLGLPVVQPPSLCSCGIMAAAWVVAAVTDVAAGHVLVSLLLLAVGWNVMTVSGTAPRVILLALVRPTGLTPPVCN